MGNYITNAVLTRQSGTTLNTTIQDEMITFAEGELTAKLTAAGESDDYTNNLLKAVATWYSCKYIYNRNKLDGTRPENLSVGGFSIGTNVEAGIKTCQDQGDMFLDAFVKGKAGDPYDQSAVDVAQTVVRDDHRMTTFQLDQSQDVEYHDRADEYGTQEE